LDLHKCMTSILNIQFLDPSPYCPKECVDKYQKLINRGVSIYENYMVYSDPKFDLKNVSTICDTTKIKKLNPELQKYLYKAYVDNRLNMPKTKIHGGVELNRLEDIKAFGKNTISFSTIFSQYAAYRVPGIKGYLPYTTSDKTAVIVGDPISDNPKVLIKSFIAKCGRENINPAAIQVKKNSALILKNEGFALNAIGIETHIDLNLFDTELKGKTYEKIRRWRNTAVKNNITVKELYLSSVRQQDILKVSKNWIKEKKNKTELGVLLRELSLKPEPYVRRFFAFKDQQIVAYIFFDPLFEENTIIGYYVNIERYHIDADTVGGKRPHGLIPYIILNAIDKFINENIRYVSLGLSPLYKVREGEINDNLELMELFEYFYQQSELYSFKGIAEHKRRYPASFEIPVFFCTKKGNSIEDIFNIFDSIGILNSPSNT